MRNNIVPALQDNKKLSEPACETARPVSARQVPQLARRTGMKSRLFAAQCLTVAGLILIAAGFDLSDHAIDWPGAALMAGAAASFLAAQIVLAAAGTLPAATGIESGEHENQLEQLKDAQWVLSENEARYRDLLDTQDDLISRRDELGRYVFVNKAFCSAFGVTPPVVIGKRFQPDVLDGQVHAPLSSEFNQRRCYEELVQTQRGPRWISWEEQLVRVASGAGHEVQSIGRDVSNEREAEALLTEARDQAQAANRAKSRFLAAMSHEIRTPMNGILGMTSLLSDTPQSAEQRTYLAAIGKSARALLALIDEILDFSKIEAGKMELAHAPFGLQSCVMSAIELLAPRAREKGLDLAWSFAPDLPETLVGDELRVRQIVLNLVSNAVKFTDTGRVRVTVLLAGNDSGEGASEIAISVADTGIGLAAGDMQKLFDEFEQAEPALTRQEGGTGLGLAISRRIARAMGGDISAEGALGQGATFTAVLRLDQAPDGAPVAAQLEPSLIPVSAGISNESLEVSASGQKKPRVLIAEDNEINALLARRVVEKSDCHPVVVGTGAHAVAAIKAMLAPGGEAIDLILMDVFMPGLDGMAAAREIARLFQEQLDPNPAMPNPGLKRPPIIALTANAFAEDRQRCLAAGMDDYLAKPFDAADLKALLDRWVRTAGPAASGPPPTQGS